MRGWPNLTHLTTTTKQLLPNQTKPDKNREKSCEFDAELWTGDHQVLRQVLLKLLIPLWSPSHTQALDSMSGDKSMKVGPWNPLMENFTLHCNMCQPSWMAEPLKRLVCSREIGSWLSMMSMLKGQRIDKWLNWSNPRIKSWNCWWFPLLRM